jgi:hypothetical protein
MRDLIIDKIRSLVKHENMATKGSRYRCIGEALNALKGVEDTRKTPIVDLYTYDYAELTDEALVMIFEMVCRRYAIQR